MIPYFELVNENTITFGFDSGNSELNQFLKNFALLYQNRCFGVTMICFENSSKNAIIGYYTLCPASIQNETLPNKISSGPRPNPIPGFRLCRLAIDKKFQGNGWGKLLFVHALKKCVDQSCQMGGSVVIIDAKNDQAKQFYKHFGFIELLNNSMALMQTIKFIKKHF